MEEIGKEKKNYIDPHSRIVESYSPFRVIAVLALNFAKQKLIVQLMTDVKQRFALLTNEDDSTPSTVPKTKRASDRSPFVFVYRLFNDLDTSTRLQTASASSGGDDDNTPNLKMIGEVFLENL